MVSPFDTFVDFAQLLLRSLCTFGFSFLVHFKTDRMQPRLATLDARAGRMRAPATMGPERGGERTVETAVAAMRYCERLANEQTSADFDRALRPSARICVSCSAAGAEPVMRDACLS
jgi:hypothetical protein